MPAAADTWLLGGLLGGLMLLRILRLREQHGRRTQVVWIAQGDDVKGLLGLLSGEYRLTRREVRESWLGGAVLSLVGSLAMGRLVLVWREGPGTSPLGDFTRVPLFPPAVAIGGLILGAGLLVTYWSTKATLYIRPEYVEYSGMPLVCWRLLATEIARVGRQHSGQGALVLETRSAMRRAARIGDALATALSSSGVAP